MKIFISYRRDDSQWPADRLYEALKAAVPNPDQNIFIDVDNIPLGVDFKEHLDNRVAQCEVLLALIGRSWLDARNPETGSRRLDDAGDFVRIEIASALKRGIPVVPILIDGTRVPKPDELPEDLKSLSHRNGVELNRLSFDADVERLIRGLGLASEPPQTAQHQPTVSPTRKNKRPPRPTGRGAALVALWCVIAAAVATPMLMLALWAAQGRGITGSALVIVDIASLPTTVLLIVGYSVLAQSAYGQWSVGVGLVGIFAGLGVVAVLSRGTFMFFPSPVATMATSLVLPIVGAFCSNAAGKLMRRWKRT